MANFAYLRVSKDTQDVENQKFGILDYCNQKKIAPITIVEDTESRSKSWHKRGIGKILQKTSKGDKILVAEVSRLGGSPLQVLEILEAAAKREIAVHIVKSQLIMNGSLQSTIIATVLGLAAQIEREFISVRTKEALAKRKAEGVKLGRPKGHAKNLKHGNLVLQSPPVFFTLLIVALSNNSLKAKFVPHKRAIALSYRHHVLDKRNSGDVF